MTRADLDGLLAPFADGVRRAAESPGDVERLGHAHEASLAPADRRASGAHYTPRALTGPLVRLALGPLARSRSSRQLLALRVNDPACGGGAFLAEACRFLAGHLLRAWRREGVAGSLRDALRLVAGRCVSGTDVDPAAVEVARLSLRLLADDPTLAIAVRAADGLAEAGDFDASLSNPPFVNAIDGRLPPRTKSELRRRFPVLGGTADLSSYFLAHMHATTRPAGTVAAVLPRPFLGAPSAAGLRATLDRERPPAAVYHPEEGAFDGARVRVAAVVLRPSPRPCGWWEGGGEPASRTVGEGFAVMASMTAGMAYELLPFVSDGDGDGPRLVTTGLIDPGRCLWGRARCRYLKRVFDRPRVGVAGAMPAALRRRLELVRRPKVLVAGVLGPGGNLEAFVDREGDRCGAVSTYTILDERDDVARLGRLAERLNRESQARRALGASAMGAGLVTVTKAYLRGLRWA